MAYYNVVIVEDDAYQGSVLAEMVKQFPSEDSFFVEVCSSVRDFEAMLRRGYTPDIVFMDILLSENDAAPNGIDLAERLLMQYGGAQLIYVTGCTDYFVSVYRTSHTYLLTKPIVKEDFSDAMEKALSNLTERLSRPFGIKVGGRIMRVIPDEVEYVESDRRKLRIYMNGEMVEAYESLGGIAKKLPMQFVQCHKSFLVNMNKVVEMRSDSIELASGAIVPVSQKRSKETREAFMKHLRDRL